MKKIKIKKFILSKSLIKFFEGDDFKEIRDYIPGEDVRNIHWLSSSKHQKLLSIQRENLKNQKIILAILLDKNMLFEDKLDIVKEILNILAFSAIYYKHKLKIYLITDKIEIFDIKNISQIKKILNKIDTLNLKKINLKNFYIKEKNALAIYIGDFFYKIKLNKKNKNILLFVRKKIEENPKSLLFKNVKSVDNKLKTFIDLSNIKHYLSTLKRNDAYYKKIKKRKIYSKINLLPILKETFE